ncbi:MAG: TrpR like protein, YerC/YecD [Berkelbacteria bacterium GW2011_GWA1_36_9]|uniref:TrpR like protein, YerC/YecD n=1 Tax=Berkelbacteria bacterium GW2011_GWA1_36_9 TaxID=1618331 RepID=A0A0G0IRC9_9BACT|nr:MAG: TrpR like protein, YerC/YecD [Berkelbacteria bacterium GW2011_GWA1_36_9]
MISKKDNKKIMELFKAVLTLKTSDEARRFFRDLLTEKELIEFGKRWKAARMLSKNIPYVEIEKETGLSSTTVARVSKWLNNGENGYRLVLRKLGLVKNNHNNHLLR